MTGAQASVNQARHENLNQYIEKKKAVISKINKISIVEKACIFFLDVMSLKMSK